MFSIISHDRKVYSLIKVTELTKPVFSEEGVIEELIFLWANKTAIPFIKHLERFITDDVDWVIK